MAFHFFQHYGVDWIAMVLTFFAIYSLGNKQRYGFCIMMAGNACWIVLAVRCRKTTQLVCPLRGEPS